MFIQLMHPDSPGLEAVSDYFALGPFRSAEIIPSGATGACYWNCDAYVESYGGKVMYGWQCRVWPGLFIEMLHHAVVELSDGRLVDPTDPGVPNNGLTAIVLDQTIVPPRDYPIYVPNKYCAVPGVSEEQQRACQAMVNISGRQLRVRRQIAEIAKGLGLSFPIGEHVALPPTEVVMRLSQEHQAAAEAYDQAVEECRRVTPAEFRRPGD